MRRLLACAVLASVACLSAVALGLSALAQSAPQIAVPTGVVIGKVVDGVRNSPVTGAIVTLVGPGQRQRVLVDGQGRFLFTALPAGAFTITATRTGYLDGGYGVLRADGAGRALELQDGERVIDATVRMWRYATIAGAVVDDAGDPVGRSPIQAFRRTIVGGRWRFKNAASASSTDERGGYRITGLVPGEYALVMTSFHSTMPPSLLSIAAAWRTMTSAESLAMSRELGANGVNGYINDLMQGSPVVRIGDQLLQASGTSTPTPTDGKSLDLYPTVWYPNAPTPATATIVTVTAGENRTGIDLHPVVARAIKISGTVVGPNGPIPHMALRLQPARMEDVAAIHVTSLSASLNSSIAVSDATGAFTFLVAPGPYVIRALTNPPRAEEKTPPPAPPAQGQPPVPPLIATDPTLWAALPVTAGDIDVTGLTVALRPGLRVTGRVVFEGAAVKPTPYELRSIRVSMDPADGQTTEYPTAYQGQVDSAGGFYTLGLIARRYVVRFDNAPRNWSLKSAMVGGRDISDLPLTLDTSDADGLIVTFTDRPASVSGTVRTSKGDPDPDATVLLFPADGVWTNRGGTPRRMRSVRASRTGSFTFAGVPEGDYMAIAVSDAVASNWQDPTFLQRIARLATRLAVGDGQAATLGLTTTGGISR